MLRLPLPLHSSRWRAGVAALAGAALIALIPVTARAQSGSAAASPAAAHRPASEPGAARQRVLIMDLKAVGVETAVVTVVTGLITDAVSRYPSLQTISTADIRQLVELEGEKQQVGCDTDSCLAEVAGAMGARYVIFGNVGQLGSTLVMQLNLFDSAAAQAVKRESIKVSDHDALAAAVDPAVANLLEGFVDPSELAHQRARAGTVTTTAGSGAAPAAPGSGDLGWLRWTGGITALVGTVGFGVAWTVGTLLALTAPAPGAVMQQMVVPLVGPLQALDTLAGYDEGDATAYIAPTAGLAAAEWLAALVAVGGLGALTGGIAFEQPGPDAGGQAWLWGLVGGGLALMAGGVAFDAFAETSHDQQLTEADTLSPLLYLAGAAAIAAGLAVPLLTGGEE